MADSLYTVFHKFCPQCAAGVSRDAESCDCGYSFNANGAEDVASPLAQAIAEEKLYEDYLNARVTQTAQAAIAAQSVHQSAPHDAMYATAARNAVEEAERSRAELAAQSAKIAEMELALIAEQEPARKPAAKSAATRVETPAQAPIATPVVSVAAAASVPAPVPVAPTAPVLTAPIVRDEAPKLAKSSAPVPTVPAAVATLPTPREGTAALATQSKSVAPPQHAASAPTHEAARVLKKNLSTHANEVTSAAEALRAELAQMRNRRRDDAHDDGERANDTHRASSKSVPNPNVSNTATQREAVAPVKNATAAAAAPTETLAARTAASVVSGTPRPVVAKPVKEILDQANTVKKVKREAAQAAKAQQIQQARLARQAERARKAQSTPAPQTGREPATATTTETSGDVGDPVPAPAPALTSVKAAAVRTTTPTAVVKSKECANCTATVALSVRHCKCGCDFPDLARATMPALVLDPSDVKNVVDLYHRRR